MPTPSTQSAGLELRLTLTWPDSGLSPNARLHWSRKARKVKAARTAAWGAVLELADCRAVTVTGKVGVTVTFCPPDGRRRDLDNLIASMKAANDGIADALGVDDSRFVSTYSMGEVVKGGAVHVVLRGCE